MKKLLALALVLSMVLCMFAACTGSDDTDPTTKPSTSTTPTGPNTPTDPNTPTNPTDPTNPAGPTDPTNPSDPTDPTPPTGPDVPADEMEITVTPAEMEIYAGEEIDLMFGVFVNNSKATLIIFDDEDFDQDTPGTYTITYQASLDGVKVTATRTITVLEALSNIALEVRNNNLGENKWQGKLLSFANNLYVVLTQDTELSKQSGVFHNTTDKDIILTVAGTHGCAAILDKNGVVIEGRDGANSKLVNGKNPTRAGSSATTLTIDGESVTVSSAFAKKLTIPAGGFAIIVQANYAGATADTDGRGFMNYNVIYEIGNVVRLFWVDTDETLTPYINQKPTVSGNNKILIQLGDTEFDLDAAVIAGIIAKDDNGTFANTDDVTLEDIKIVDKGGFDANKKGTYTVKLSVSDGKLTTEFTREIEVKSEGVGTLNIGENKMNVALDFVAKDKELTSIGNNVFLIYTAKYNGELPANGYGVAIVVNKYGEIVRIYDGANGKYYDAKNATGIVDSAKCDPKTYLTQAVDSLQSGELVIVAPNSTANNAEGGSRKFLLANRTVGAVVSGLGLTFESKTEEDPCKDGHSFVNGVCGNCGAEDPNYDPCADGHNYVNGVCTRCEAEDPDYVIPDDSKTITIGDKTFIAGDWAYNDSSVVATNAAKYAMIIYDKSYTGEVALNGYGAALVLNKYGQLIKIYDAANGGFWTVAGKSTAALTFTTANYATVAFSELAEGELLIIFPNDGGANGNAARGWALGLRSNNYLGKAATLTGFEFAADPCADGHDFKDGACTRCGAEDPDFDPCEKGHDFKDGKCTRCEAEDPNYVVPGESKTITIGTKTPFTALDGKWAYNDSTITAANAGSYSMIIYDGNYAGTVALNGYGAALVINKYGELVKIYDGANVGLWTKDGKAASAGFTAANYATVAFEALEEGEMLLVFPHDGGSNPARTWALGLRNAPSGPSECGQVITLTGFTFETKPTDDKTITIGTKAPLTIAEGKWTYNNANITTGNAAGYGLIIFDKSFTGTFTTNGYGVALVVNKYGELVKIYDGANVGFWTAEGKAATPGFTSSTYATVAFEALEDGEMLLIFPNDGGSNTARNWANGLRNAPSGPSECGKVITLTGFTFEVKPSDDKVITVGDKTFTSVEGKWAYNADVTAATAPNYSMIIFDGKYEGSVAINGYGVAIVLNKYGVLDRVYDGANVGFWTADGKAASAGFTASNYATVAFESLTEGETLVIFPNGGDNAHRAWALGIRSLCGQAATLTGFEFEEIPSKDVTVTISDKTFTAVDGKWAYNTDVTAATAANYTMIIFDSNYEGTVAINGYGVAVVQGKDGKLDRVYDGANVGFWTADGKAASAGFTAANYATVAFESLTEGETLVIFPNGGDNAHRAWALGIRSLCGQALTFTGASFGAK